MDSAMALITGLVMVLLISGFGVLLLRRRRGKSYLGADQEGRSVLRFLGRVFLVAFLATVLSMLISTPASAVLGGYAASGKIDSGRYYLGNGRNYVEVSRLVFTVSYLHGLANFLLTGFTLGSFAVLAGWRISLAGSDDSVAKTDLPNCKRPR